MRFHDVSERSANAEVELAAWLKNTARLVLGDRPVLELSPGRSVPDMESWAGWAESAAGGLVKEGWCIGLPLQPTEHAGRGWVETEDRAGGFGVGGGGRIHYETKHSTARIGLQQIIFMPSPEKSTTAHLAMTRPPGGTRANAYISPKTHKAAG